MKLFTAVLLLLANTAFAQNVGIGTTNPLQKLHIKTTAPAGATEGILIESTSSTVGFGNIFSNPSTTWYLGPNIGNYPDGRFKLTNLSSPLQGFLVMPNGQVGIGDFSGAGNIPAANMKLHVKTDGSNMGEGVMIESPASNVGFGLEFKNPTRNWFLGPNTGNYADARFRISSDSVYGQGITVMPDGQVGIGDFTGVGNIPAADQKLHIKTAGSVNFEGMLLESPTTNTGFGITYKNPSTQWIMGVNPGNYTDGRFMITNATTGYQVMTCSSNGLAGFGNFVGAGGFFKANVEVNGKRKIGILSYTDSAIGSVSSAFYLGAPAGVRGEYRGAGANDGSGVMGVALSPGSGFGIGVTGSGGWYGVLGLGQAGSTAGLLAIANGATYALLSNGNFQLNGNFSGTGTNTYTSDRKLKKDIAPITGALALIAQLKPSTYQFRVGEFGSMYLAGGKHYGLIAQDLQQVLPELVTEQQFTPVDKKEKGFDYLSVNYNELIPLLIKSVQEQQQIIDGLKARIEKLEKAAGK